MYIFIGFKHSVVWWEKCLAIWPLITIWVDRVSEWQTWQLNTVFKLNSELLKTKLFKVICVPCISAFSPLLMTLLKVSKLLTVPILFNQQIVWNVAPLMVYYENIGLSVWRVPKEKPRMLLAYFSIVVLPLLAILLWSFSPWNNLYTHLEILH